MSAARPVEDPPDRDRRATFVAVILVEAAVIIALWLFSHHFGR